MRRRMISEEEGERDVCVLPFCLRVFVRLVCVLFCIEKNERKTKERL